VNDNTNFYNINVFNSYGAGAQVFSQQWNYSMNDLTFKRRLPSLAMHKDGLLRLPVQELSRYIVCKERVSILLQLLHRRYEIWPLYFPSMRLTQARRNRLHIWKCSCMVRRVSVMRRLPLGNLGCWPWTSTIASSGGGYVTANSRELATDPAMYVFDHSTVSDLNQAVKAALNS
jgi:hypothetical protein